MGYFDLTGCCEQDDSVQENSFKEKISQELLNNSYGYLVDGLDIFFAGLGTTLKNEAVEMIKPNNIGIGIWKKWVSSQLDDLGRLFGASADDVVRGFANIETTGFLPQIIEKAGYVGVAVDVGIGINENIEEGVSAEVIVADATVDAAFSIASMVAAGKMGAAGGTVAGSIVPGIGNVAGAIAGFAAGIGLYFVTDVIKVEGKSIKDHVKDGVKKFLGID